MRSRPLTRLRSSASTGSPDWAERQVNSARDACCQAQPRFTSDASWRGRDSAVRSVAGGSPWKARAWAWTATPRVAKVFRSSTEGCANRECSHAYWRRRPIRSANSAAGSSVRIGTRATVRSSRCAEVGNDRPPRRGRGHRRGLRRGRAPGVGSPATAPRPVRAAMPGGRPRTAASRPGHRSEPGRPGGRPGHRVPRPGPGFAGHWWDRCGWRQGHWQRARSGPRPPTGTRWVGSALRPRRRGRHGLVYQFSQTHRGAFGWVRGARLGDAGQTSLVEQHPGVLLERTQHVAKVIAPCAGQATMASSMPISPFAAMAGSHGLPW